MAGHDYQKILRNQIHPNPSPGGSGKPPVSDFIFSCNTTSALRRASACAATMRSSRTSFSEGLRRESSILMPLRSPFAVRITVTKPPPAVPSTSIWSSSACMACILDCNCAACFISPRKSGMSLLLAVGGNIRLGVNRVRVLPHTDDFGSRKPAQHGLNQRIALHAAFNLRLLGFSLRTKRGGALLLGYDDDPALSGPAGQLPLQIVHQRFRRARLKRDLELAILAAH